MGIISNIVKGTQKVVGAVVKAPGQVVTNTANVITNVITGGTKPKTTSSNTVSSYQGPVRPSDDEQIFRTTGVSTGGKTGGGGSIGGTSVGGSVGGSSHKGSSYQGPVRPSDDEQIFRTTGVSTGVSLPKKPETPKISSFRQTMPTSNKEVDEKVTKFGQDVLDNTTKGFNNIWNNPFLEEGRTNSLDTISKGFYNAPARKEYSEKLEPVNKFLTDVEEKINNPTQDTSSVNRQRWLEANIAVYNSHSNSVDSQITKFNEQFGGKELSSEEYAVAEQKLNNIKNEQKKLDILYSDISNQENIIRGFESDKRKKDKTNIIGQFGQAVMVGAVTAPIVLAKTGIGLVTKPLTTGKEVVSGYVELPKQILESPINTIGTLTGQMVFGGLVGRGLSGASKTTSVKVRNVKPKVTVSNEFSEILKIDEKRAVVEGVVETNTISPITGRLIRRKVSKVNAVAEVVENPLGGFNVEGGSISKTTRGKVPRKYIKENKETGKIEVKQSKFTGSFESLEEGGVKGAIHTITKNIKTVRLVRTPKEIKIIQRKLRLSNEYDTLSNVFSKEVGKPQLGTKKINNLLFEGERNFFQGGGVSTTTLDKFISKSSKGKKYLRVNREPMANEINIAKNRGSVFTPKSLLRDTRDFSFQVKGGAKANVPTGGDLVTGQVIKQGTKEAVMKSALQEQGSTISNILKREAESKKVRVKTTTIKQVPASTITGMVSPLITKSITKTTTNSKTRLGQDLIGRTKERNLFGIRTGETTKVAEETTVTPSSREELGLFQPVKNIQRELQQQKQSQQQQQRQISNLIPITPSPINTPNFNFPEEIEKMRTPIILPGGKKGKDYNKPYDAYYLRDATKSLKRKWIKVGNNLPYETALAIGARQVDETVSNRFKVVPDKGKVKEVQDQGWKVLAQKFRNYLVKQGNKQKQTNTWIEKTKYKIDSPGEKRKLQSERESSVLFSGMRR